MQPREKQLKLGPVGEARCSRCASGIPVNVLFTNPPLFASKERKFAQRSNYGNGTRSPLPSPPRASPYGDEADGLC